MLQFLRVLERFSLNNVQVNLQFKMNFIDYSFLLPLPFKKSSTIYLGVGYWDYEFVIHCPNMILINLNLIVITHSCFATCKTCEGNVNGNLRSTLPFYQSINWKYQSLKWDSHSLLIWLQSAIQEFSNHLINLR